MQKIGNLVPAVNPSCGLMSPVHQTSIGEEKTAPLKWIDEVFARFTNIYKTKWIELHPTAIIEKASKYEWALSLSDLTYEQIKSAINYCGKQITWPPLAPEFRLLALSLFPISPKYQTFIAVEWIRTPRDIQLAEAAIANIRKMLPRKINRN